MHREERDFSIHLHLSASFDDAYEGDDDGFVWFEKAFESDLKPALVRALFDVLRQDPRFQAVSAPRGREPSHGVDFDVAFTPPSR
jgi:hypothetical protein